jgi:DNA primase
VRSILRTDIRTALPNLSPTHNLYRHVTLYKDYSNGGIHMYVDFRHVKEHVQIEQVIPWLGLAVKKAGEQLRGRCPLHDGGERALVITPSKGLWYCFAPECQAGGDVIELVAKVRGISQRDAAIALQKHFLSDPHAPGEAKHLEPLDYLVAEHEMVQALGFPREIAEALGIGYAPKGIMRGRVAIPIRMLDGTLVAYAGVNTAMEPVLKLPSKFCII